MHSLAVPCDHNINGRCEPSLNWLEADIRETAILERVPEIISEKTLRFLRGHGCADATGKYPKKKGSPVAQH
jgi:hypothetical protein